MPGYPHSRILGAALPLLLGSLALAGDNLEVLAVEPAAGSRGASVKSSIVVRFDRPVLESSITTGANLSAFGRWSGPAPGSYSFADGGRTVVLTPDTPFSAGETVMVILSHDAEAIDGSPLRGAGYSWQFWTAARSAEMNFTEVDRKTTRTLPTITSRAYGGIASDLNGDGFLDVTVVNEDSADLRVFINRADGTGTFKRFLQPTFPVGNRASPSEPADFNRDGQIDICVANINDHTVSVLLGDGDGTFGPQQTIGVGLQPRGIAVLDVDGDGDVDIVNTNSTSGSANMTLLLNDGQGVFGAPIFFQSGLSFIWALAATDMNADGILDLVAGARDAESLIVLEGTGTTSFLQGPTQDAGGRVWMISPGDVNADGMDDVLTSNSFSNTQSILMNAGDGTLAAPLVYPSDPFGLATDLGDVNGDGHLDWITSSLNGDWRLSVNDGAGNFTLVQEFIPATASSCALMLDFDNDGDLDLALIDELADEVIFMQNSGLASAALPPGVPGGVDDTPLTVDKLDAAGSGLALSWDASSCDDAVDHQLLYGGRDDWPGTPGGGYTLSGGRCAIGAAPPFPWLAVPDPAPGELLWFVVVATDGEGTEGAWGDDGGGAERSGPLAGGASGECEAISKSLANNCG